MKKHSTLLTVTTLILVASMFTVLVNRYQVSARTNPSSSTTPVSSAATSTTQQGINLPKAKIYALTSDNMIYVLAPGSSSFAKVGRVPRTAGNLIGIDFRVSNNGLYGLTDT